MKNKSKNKLEDKAATKQFILSEQQVLQSKPPIDKKKLLADKEKSKAEKKAKKGWCAMIFFLPCCVTVAAFTFHRS